MKSDLRLLLVLLLTAGSVLGCHGDDAPAATPTTAEVATPAAPPPAPGMSSRNDPLQVPGPDVSCASDSDCVPLTACGMTEPGMCVAQSEAPPVTAECAHPVESTYRCACENRQCVSKPISP